MFDDPKKELRRLEEALLAEESDEIVKFEENWEDDSDDDWIIAGLPRYNAAVDFGRTLYDDETFDEDMALLAETGRKRKEKRISKKENKALHKKDKKKTKKRKSIISQLISFLLKIFGILYIIRWCIEWLT